MEVRCLLLLGLLAMACAAFAMEPNFRGGIIMVRPKPGEEDSLVCSNGRVRKYSNAGYVQSMRSVGCKEC